MKESDEMLSIFIIVFFVIIFTAIIIEIIGKRATRVGKHFANNKSKSNSKSKENIDKSNDATNIPRAITPYYRNKSNHKEDLLKIKKLGKELNLFDTSIYNNLFSSGVRERGEVYFKEDRISNLSQVNNKYTCQVNGTNKYDVTLTFNDKNPNEIKEASCTCPYYTGEHKYCKHIYALLYKIKCSNNQEIIDNKFAQICSETADMITKAVKDVNKNFGNYNRNIVEQFIKYAKNIQKQLESMAYSYIKLKTENAKLNALQCLIETVDGVDLRVNNFMKKMKDPAYADDDYYEDIDDDFDDDDFDDDNEEEDSKTRLLNELAIYQMSNNLFNNKSHKKENFSDYSEQDLADSGLEEWQKDEVRKGNWEPWSFDENNEFEDDDYYSDNGEDDD